MKPTPVNPISDIYANWMSTGLSMMLGEFPSAQAKEPAPKIELRGPVRRAAPAKKRRTSRKAKGAKRR
jgi:hypothetical protein